MKFILVLLISLLPAFAQAAPFVSTYKTLSGQVQPMTVGSALDADGKPLVSAYRDAAGIWHPTTIIENICGLDASNAPIVCNNLTQNMIGIPNGIAGLSTVGAITAPISTSGQALLGSTDWLGAWATSSVDPFARGYEAALFGGVTDTGEGNNTWMPRTLLVESDPYGPYSTGCAVGSAMLGSQYSAQYPVSGLPPANGATTVVGVGGFDTVNHCLLNSNQPARLILTVAAYTATSALLATPLTAAQAAQIHPNMYITTNSPNTALKPAATTGSLPPRNLYAGFVASQPLPGATSISVFAWDVPGLGTGASGQVPQTTNLDAVWSAYPSPTVFLGGGAGGSSFATNEFYNVQASDLTPSASNRSLVHQFTRDEVDLNIIGTAPPNSILWTGFNMNAGNQPAALTQDSHQFYMGGAINHHLIIDGACGNWDIETNSVKIPQAQCGISSGTPTRISQEWMQYIDGANNMRFDLYDTLSNPNASIGWEQATVHLGPTVDGNAQQSGDPGGSKQGDVEFNPAIPLSAMGGTGYYQPYGGIGLCGYAAHCGLVVDGGGSVQIIGTDFYLWGNGAAPQVDFGIYNGSVYITPKTANLPAGTVPQMYVRMPVAATSYQETLTTPASSSASCTAGQFTDDANYHYVCVSSNTWKRVALSSF